MMWRMLIYRRKKWLMTIEFVAQMKAAMGMQELKETTLGKFPALRSGKIEIHALMDDEDGSRLMEIHFSSTKMRCKYNVEQKRDFLLATDGQWMCVNELSRFLHCKIFLINGPACLYNIYSEGEESDRGLATPSGIFLSYGALPSSSS
jgi:hypothetical protein